MARHITRTSAVTAAIEAIRERNQYKPLWSLDNYKAFDLALALLVEIDAQGFRLCRIPEKKDGEVEE